MYRAVIVIALLLLSVAQVSAANLLANGDFETGDLSGWSEEGPTYYTWKFQSCGAPPVPAQVFSAEVPMSIIEVYYGKGTLRYQRPIGLLPELLPSHGKWALGWTRSGWDHMGYGWARQILRVAPGKYLMNASWDVCVWNTQDKGEPDKKALAGMFMVHVDEHVDHYTVDETAFRKTVWDAESLGKWVSKSVSDIPIETKTGMVEVRLQYLQAKLTPHATTAPLPPPHYEYVGFDNVTFMLTPLDSDKTVTEVKL